MAMFSTKSSFGKKATSAVFISFCMFLSGAGVGWLIGLSVSPVLYILITSLISVVAGITSALAGLAVDRAKDESSEANIAKPKRNIQINPLPVTALILGLVAGASLGVYARTNEWLAPNIDSLAEKWKDAELTKRDIARHIFEQLHGTIVSSPVSPPSSETPEKKDGTISGTLGSKPPATSPEKAPAAIFGQGVLFQVPLEECNRIRTKRDDELKDELIHSSNPEVSKHAQGCKDIRCLKELVEKICPTKK